MGDKWSSVSSLQIPVIDISDAASEDTADQLVDAVARYGFVYVRGEGIGFTKHIIDNAFKLVKTERLPPRRTDNANITYIVTKILLVNFGRQSKMRYPSQCKTLPPVLSLVTGPVSQIRARTSVGRQCTQKPWTPRLRRY